MHLLSSLLITFAFIDSTCHQEIACPSDVCVCKDLFILCSKRTLERVPQFDETDNPGIVYNELDLSRNDIYSIPPNAFSNIRVKSIDLGQNAIVGISPRGFNGVGEVLESLNLCNAAIKVLHWAVFQESTQLISLDLSRNVMFDIPVGLFDNLNNLKTLNIAWNRLFRLKFGVFRKLSQLKKLNLVGNLIAELEPKVFEDLVSLTTLKLNSNRLKSLNSDIFDGLNKLNRLELENNFINTIESGAFLLPRVEDIFLLGNNITVLGSQTFRGASRLQSLYLQDNKITNITASTFVTTPNLGSLNLERNRLTVLGSSCNLYGLYNLKHLFLDDNPISCDCNIAWINRFKAEGTIINGECASPPNNIGDALQDYSVNTTWCIQTGKCSDQNYSDLYNQTINNIPIPIE